MEIGLTLPDELPDVTRVELARGYLEALTRTDRYLVRNGWVPPLYSTRVLYRLEPRGIEQFVDALTCYRRGWGDCAHLSAWRIAEYLEQGIEASPLFHARFMPRENRYDVHCVIRLPDGSQEDPSRRMRELEKRRK